MCLFSLRWLPTISNVSDSGLSITFTGSSPLIVKTGRNITIRWTVINQTPGYSVIDIKAFAQSQLIKETQIVYYSN